MQGRLPAFVTTIESVSPSDQPHKTTTLCYTYFTGIYIHIHDPLAYHKMQYLYNDSLQFLDAIFTFSSKTAFFYFFLFYHTLDMTMLGTS